MSRYWKPLHSPPKLDKFCHLSSDAQVVMAAIYRQFKLQKEAKLASQNSNALIKEGVSDYYCEMYNKRFGGPLRSGSPIRHQIENKEREDNNSCDEEPTGILQTLTTVPESPEVMCEKRNLIAYNNDNASEIHLGNDEKENAHEVISDDKMNAGEVHTAHVTPAAATGQMNKYRNPRHDETAKQCSLGEPEDSINSSIKSLSNDFIKDQQQLQIIDSISSEDCMQTDDCLDQQFQQIELETPQQKILQQKPAPCSISRKLQEHAIIRNVKANERQDATSSIDMNGASKKSCKQLQLVSKKNPGISNNAPKKKLSQFFIPYKKQKLSTHNETPARCNVNLENADTDSHGGDTLTVVDTLDEESRRSIARQLVQCPEVLFSLVYKDKSTQLRDNILVNHKKKATTSVKNRKSSEVQFIGVQIGETDVSCSDDVIKGDKYSTAKRTWAFPVASDSQQYLEWNRTFWKNMMSSTNRKICCNAKQMLLVLVQELNIHDVKDCMILDPVIASWVLDPDTECATFHQCLSKVCLQQKDVVCKVGVDVLHEDMPLMSELMKRLYQKLQSRELWDLFYCVEVKLIPLLAVMELRPLKTDMDTLLNFSDVLKKKLQKLEQKAFQVVGHSFLINSPAQLRQVMFEELQLDKKITGKAKLAKTQVGHLTSTSEIVLNQLVDTHPLPSIILEYRQIQKLKSTYVDGMMSCITEGYLYTHWDQTSAATGRLSSYQPNIQAIPKTPVVITDYSHNFIIGKMKEEKLEIFARDVFLSHEGFSFLAADFQQIELRLLAHLADDAVLIQIFNKSDSTDIFLQLTSQWLSKPEGDVTAQDREQTKRVVYSVMYGAGKNKLAEYLKISSNDAKAIMDSFLVKFPAVNMFSKKCIEFCQQNGYTSTIFKRRRLFPNIISVSPQLRAQAERQAVNFRVQGSAADLCKAAMIQVEHTLEKHKQLHAKLLVQIHDELLLEVADEDLFSVQNLVKSVMEDSESLCGQMVKLKIPLKVSLSAGKTWGHMSPI